MGEWERIARLRSAFASEGEAIRVGIGDDAAVVRFDGDVVLSTDASIEHVHFRRSFGPLDRLAERAFHAAASDLAAMAAEPVSALVSLSLPALDEASFDRIVEGLARASRALGLPIVGGNLASASELGITTTVVGRARGPVLRRDGARVGHAIYVSGALGVAALGLRGLLADRPGPFAERWLGVRARFDVARAIAGVASAAIDVSDGLASDLGHVLAASAVGATLEAAALPQAEGFAEAAGADALALALNGGEDYELCFTAPEGSIPADVATRIGRIDAEPGLRVDDGASVVEHPLAGFRHFQ